MTSKFKTASPATFWNTVEQIYGQIPHLIKLVLQINGFDSFLALKGIRYDEKHEFFQSLESTVVEIVTSDDNTQDVAELLAEIVSNHQKAEKFKLKPGHRNYIMNLMMEIEKTDVNDFFGHFAVVDPLEPEKVETESSPVKQYTIAHVNPPETSSNLFVRRSNSEKPIIVGSEEHGYSQDQEPETEYIYEEEYLTDEDPVIRVEYETVESQEIGRKRKSSSNCAPGSAKRKPTQMYNDEFMAKCVNPRRRRVTMNKSYPATDEGTRERFRDLIQQSMECILSRDRLSEVDGCEIHVEKESETSWAVYCPLCHARIRLPVVLENGGRYCNYKRSNFERHLRFKHCKVQSQGEVYDAVESIEEIVG